MQDSAETNRPRQASHPACTVLVSLLLLFTLCVVWFVGGTGERLTAWRMQRTAAATARFLGVDPELVTAPTPKAQICVALNAPDGKMLASIVADSSGRPLLVGLTDNMELARIDVPDGDYMSVRFLTAARQLVAYFQQVPADSITLDSVEPSRRGDDTIVNLKLPSRPDVMQIWYSPSKHRFTHIEPRASQKAPAEG